MNKKHLLALVATALSFALAPMTLAHEGDDHSGHNHEKKVAGPNGGRVITTVTPHVEFFVTPERKVKLTFVGEDNKPVAAKDATASLVGGDRANPTKLAFTKDGDALVSDKPLPAGDNIPVILQIKITADAKNVTEKMNVNLADCPECKHKEYACTCAHEH